MSPLSPPPQLLMSTTSHPGILSAPLLAAFRLSRRIDRAVALIVPTIFVMTPILAVNGSPPEEVSSARIKSATQANVNRSASTLCPQASRLRDNVKVVVSDAPDSYAVAEMEKDREPDGTPKTNSSGEEQWTLTVYAKRVNGQARFPELKEKGNEVSDEYLECALRGLTLHELMHQCMNDSGDVDGFSCNHFKIDLSVFRTLCEDAAELKTLLTSEPPPTPEEALEHQECLCGLCESMADIRNKWKDPDPSDPGYGSKRQKMANCRQDAANVSGGDSWSAHGGHPSCGCGIRPISPPVPGATPNDPPQPYPPDPESGYPFPYCEPCSCL